MDAQERDRLLDEGAIRLEAAVLAARELLGTEEVWPAAMEVERIRAEVEAATGVSLVDPPPPHLVDDFVEGAARVAAEQAEKFLEANS